MNFPVKPDSLPRDLNSRIYDEQEFVGLVSTDRFAREAILHRARAIWEQEGRPENRKLDNWLQAEAEFRTRSALDGVYHGPGRPA